MLSTGDFSRGGLTPLPMCTVTFMPSRTGYCLGMNRDEKRARAGGLLPALRHIDGRDVVLSLGTYWWNIDLS
jgi:hypothetical protein